MKKPDGTHLAVETAQQLVFNFNFHLVKPDH